MHPCLEFGQYPSPNLHLCDCGSYNHITYCCKHQGSCTLTSDLWPLYNVCIWVQWSLANTMTLYTKQASWVDVGTAKGYVNWLEPRYDECIQKHSSTKASVLVRHHDSKHHCVHGKEVQWPHSQPLTGSLGMTLLTGEPGNENKSNIVLTKTDIYWKCRNRSSACNLGKLLCKKIILISKVFLIQDVLSVSNPP